MSDKTKTHPVTLIRGAAHLLALTTSVPGLVKDPVQIFRIGEVSERCLMEVGRPPHPGIRNDDPEFARKRSENLAWNNEPFPPFEVTEREREALKAMITAGVEGMTPGKSLNNLLREFGIAPEG